MTLYKIKNPLKKAAITLLDVFLGKCFTHSRPFPEVIRRILVVRLDRLGDILLTRPLLFSLRQAYPDAQIDILLKTPGCHVLKFDSFIDRVLFVSRKERGGLKYYDLVIEPKGRLDYAFLVHLLKPRFSIGFGDAGGGPFFDVSLYQPDQNPLKKNRAVCEKLKIKTQDEIPLLNVPQKLKDDFAEYGEYILISPFSSRTEKDWGITQYKMLATELENRGKSILFCGAKNREEDFGPFRQWEIRLFQPDQLDEWMALVSSVKLVIAPDSAVIHVAAAAKVPSIALYGPEDSAVWHPYESSRHQVVQTPERRMSSITVDQVLECTEGLRG